MDIKFCKDCTHYRRECTRNSWTERFSNWCINPKLADRVEAITITTLVLGPSTSALKHDAFATRKLDKLCGIRAKWFEARNDNKS